MKRSILIATILLIAANLFAQNNDLRKQFDKTYTEKLDSLLQELDRKELNSEILYDRVISYAKLDKFIQADATSKIKN